MTYPRRDPELTAHPGWTLVYVVGTPGRRGIFLHGFELIVRARDCPCYGSVVLSERETYTGSRWRLAGQEVTGNLVFEVATARVDWYPCGRNEEGRHQGGPSGPLAGGELTGTDVPLTTPREPVEPPLPARMHDACVQVTAAQRKLARRAGWPPQILDTAIVAHALPQPRRTDGRWIVGTVQDRTIDRTLQVYLADDLRTILVDSPASDADRVSSRHTCFPVTRDGTADPAYRHWIRGEEATPDDALRHARSVNAGDVHWVWLEA